METSICVRGREGWRETKHLTIFKICVAEIESHRNYIELIVFIYYPYYVCTVCLLLKRNVIFTHQNFFFSDAKNHIYYIL